MDGAKTWLTQILSIQLLLVRALGSCSKTGLGLWDWPWSQVWLGPRWKGRMS